MSISLFNFSIPFSFDHVSCVHLIRPGSGSRTSSLVHPIFSRWRQQDFKIDDIQPIWGFAEHTEDCRTHLQNTLADCRTRYGVAKGSYHASWVHLSIATPGVSPCFSPMLYVRPLGRGHDTYSPLTFNIYVCKASGVWSPGRYSLAVTHNEWLPPQSIPCYSTHFDTRVYCQNHTL